MKPRTVDIDGWRVRLEWRPADHTASYTVEANNFVWGRSVTASGVDLPKILSSIAAKTDLDADELLASFGVPP
jgi:hypothetical protein